MIISAIVAAAKNGVIGKEGKLPWDLPADLAYFRRTTLGHPVIMGRKTHESIGRALPGRQNIVITRAKDYQADGCEVANSLEEALVLAAGAEEVFVIGGQEIYELAMPKTDKIYLTKVDADIPGDRYFHYDPELWEVVSSENHAADGQNKYPFEITVLQRKDRV